MKTNKLTDVVEFYLNTSPYTIFHINEEDKNLLFEIIYGIGTLDCYCPQCKSISVFTPEDKRPQTRLGKNGPLKAIAKGDEWNDNPQNWRSTLIPRLYRCSRNKEHKMHHFLLVENQTIQKIGQFPSLADINSFEIKKYKKVLGDVYYKEFNKAIGLYSHGIGVGSYVYLRRIIENFIVKPAYENSKVEDGWDDELYNKSRVREKMTLLKKHLPPFLVENTILYSIISKGIHELSEDDCLSYFPIIKSSLELILIEIEDQRKKDEKKAEISKQLGQINGQIK